MLPSLNVYLEHEICKDAVKYDAFIRLQKIVIFVSQLINQIIISFSRWYKPTFSTPDIKCLHSQTVMDTHHDLKLHVYFIS